MDNQALQLKILIADDDPAIVESLMMILEDEGYVTDGTQGRDTINKTLAWTPDLLFLDMWMPEINGREICEWLKACEATRRLPIIMFSASRDAEPVALAAGADDFLSKPFELQRVLDAVERHIRRPA